MLVAGIAGLKNAEIAPMNPSATLLRDWIESNTFVWLITDEIVSEYKRVLARLGVRRSHIGTVINLLRDEAERVAIARIPHISPDPGDDPFCACAETGQADFVVTLNPRDFPQSLLSAHVIKPGDEVPTTARLKRRLRA